MASPAMKGQPSRQTLVDMGASTRDLGPARGGAVGKAQQAAPPETPKKGGEPQTQLASPPAKKAAHLSFGEEDVREASTKTLPAHLEKDVDKAARLERRRQAEERMMEVEAQRREHMVHLCRELAYEIFVDHVVERARILDMARRSEAAARKFAADAVCFRFMDGYTEADDQDEIGGLQLKDWKREEVPETEELEKLKIKAAERGTWVDRARKNVRNKFEGGQKEVIRNPRVVIDHYEYAGLEYKGGGQKQTECPNWDELYVGHLVQLTPAAAERKIRYSLGDKSGVVDRRSRGYPLEKAIELCKGVVFNATSDFQIKENDTYQPGVRISNYVCYPGGGAWVRWDHTKEVDYVWSNRLEPAQEGNSVDEIESRTDHIEKHNWVQLDEAVLGLTAQVAFLGNDVVARLRARAMDARMLAASHDQKSAVPLASLIKRRKKPA